MPRFTLHLEQYVQEVATVEVEAFSIEQALEMYRDGEIDDDFDWQDGNDSDETVLVKITQNDTKVWERKD